MSRNEGVADWQPVASIAAQQKRAELLALIRQFFMARNVWEVDVPVLGETAVTDLHVDCIAAHVGQTQGFLQSSPEYFMKRLLAVGSGAIYSLGKVFRNGESGVRHNPEFTMLEWYRPGWDEHQLMDEVAALVCQVGCEVSCEAAGDLLVQKQSYGEVFARVTGLDPHLSALSDLQHLAGKIAGTDYSNESRSTCLDLVFSLRVEPELPRGLVFVFDYPACQSALAQTEKNGSGVLVSRRFEAFINGMELANGYYELTDPVEQRSRFEADVALRKAANKSAVAVDEKLLAAMEAGLPACAGVALGIDRLLMQILGLTDIREVMAFPWTSAI